MTDLLDRVFGDEQPLTPDLPIVPAAGDDVDLDTYDTPDLGDYVSEQSPGGVYLPAHPVVAVVAAHQPLPFDGHPLVYHRFHQTQGRNVLAVQRALTFARLRFRPPTWSYGWLTRDEVKLLQRRAGLPVTGVYGPHEHAWLVPYFDGYARWLYTHNEQAPPRGDRSPGERIVRAAWYLYAHRPMAYHAVRPFILFPYGDRIAYQFDCSWLATEACYLAKVTDPNGYGYHGGYGNTSTLLEHGSVVTGVVQGGDLHHYGEWANESDPAHVTIEVGGFRCIGLGSPGGPRLLPSNYRTIRQTRRYA